MNRLTGNLLVSVVVAVGLLLLGPAASLQAQAAGGGGSMTVAKKDVPPDVKGTLGLGLIGAELGMVIPAVAGVDATWAFIVFPIIGAAGGAAAGYFVLEKGDHTELSVASLTAGMALLIPALVITVSETKYDPEEDEANLGRGSRAAVDARDPRYAGSGMVRVAERGVALATPAVSVVPAATADGSLKLAGAQMSLVSGRF